MGAILRYEGKVPVVEVQGYGHFSPGDEKTVDEKTAGEFEQQPCVDEGWVVERDGKKTRAAEDNESTDASNTPTPRGPGRVRKNDE
jgi:hypothetical protein